LRLHYLDEGPVDAPRTWLCLHGNTTWSYLYRKMIPVFLASGDRVVAPDLIGFGRSDKPKKSTFHRFGWHRDVLLQLVQRLDLHNVVLVVQDGGGPLGLTLPMAGPERYQGLLALNAVLATGEAPLSPGVPVWSDACAQTPGPDVAQRLARDHPQLSAAERAAYTAPFPDRGHRAALQAFAAMGPGNAEAGDAAVVRQAQDFWATQWRGQSLMVLSQQDLLLNEPEMQRQFAHIRGGARVIRLPGVGRLVPEQGEDVARQACAFFGR
jgi:tRNA(adenine34) deaminase